MHYYPIRFLFRGKERTGFVHKHSSYFAVHFSDLEIIRDFGSRIVIQKNGEALQIKEEVEDEAAFLKVLLSQLK